MIRLGLPIDRDTGIELHELFECVEKLEKSKWDHTARICYFLASPYVKEHVPLETYHPYMEQPKKSDMIAKLLEKAREDKNRKK